MGLFLTGDAGAGLQNNSMLFTVGYIVILFGIMYFLVIRPQKQEKKKQEELMAQLAIGDGVLTTAGFYGTIIDIAGDTVIVEFGNNKNCRIPIQKQAIIKSEKPKYTEETKTEN